MTASPPVVLCFSASDPCAGAGLQADLLTLAALGCQPLTVVTALTAQDTCGVSEILPLTPEWITHQAELLFADMPVAAIKIGLLASAATTVAVAECLARHPGLPVVLDPVLASGRGDALADAKTQLFIRQRLLPLATLITPNAQEAASLAQWNGGTESEEDLAACARILIETCDAGRVLITGGDMPDTQAMVVNRLYDASGLIQQASWPRLPGSYHGSGCTLASAIAAGLAKGLLLPDAVMAGQEYTWQCLADATRPGRGQALPHRLHPILPHQR